jgi:hypothetical protein
MPASQPTQEDRDRKVGKEKDGGEDLGRHGPSIFSIQSVLDVKSIDDEIENADSDRENEVDGPTVDVALIGRVGEHGEYKQDDENTTPLAPAPHAIIPFAVLRPVVPLS